jgi:hypothetical protein
MSALCVCSCWPALTAGSSMFSEVNSGPDTISGTRRPVRSVHRRELLISLAALSSVPSGTPSALRGSHPRRLSACLQEHASNFFYCDLAGLVSRVSSCEPRDTSPGTLPKRCPGWENPGNIAATRQGRNQRWKPKRSPSCGRPPTRGPATARLSTRRTGATTCRSSGCPILKSGHGSKPLAGPTIRRWALTRTTASCPPT